MALFEWARSVGLLKSNFQWSNMENMPKWFSRTCITWPSWPKMLEEITPFVNFFILTTLERYLHLTRVYHHTLLFLPTFNHHETLTSKTWTRHCMDQCWTRLWISHTKRRLIIQRPVETASNLHKQQQCRGSIRRRWRNVTTPLSLDQPRGALLSF